MIFKKHFTTLNDIYIDKNAILSNYDNFCKLNPNYKIFPVLKSNAYGHWITQIAQILNERKLDYIVVDSYYSRINCKESKASFTTELTVLPNSITTKTIAF